MMPCDLHAENVKTHERGGTLNWVDYCTSDVKRHKKVKSVHKDFRIEQELQLFLKKVFLKHL